MESKLATTNPVTVRLVIKTRPALRRDVSPQPSPEETGSPCENPSYSASSLSDFRRKSFVFNNGTFEGQNLCPVKSNT